MKDNDLTILTTLFVEHHRQLTNIREKIHGISEKTLALFLVVAGWLIVTKDQNPLPARVRGAIVVVVVVLALVSSRNVYINNRKYHQIARVIRRVNCALRLHAKGRFIPLLSLYPRPWKHFGKKGELLGALTHIVAISAGALLCVIAACTRGVQ